jgi:3-dehydroquinate dehydratase type I
MKPTFLRPDGKPMLVSVVSEHHPEACIAQLRNSIFDGADGFLLQLETLDPAHLNLNDLRHIMDYACDKPVLTTNYRRGNPGQLTDDDLVEQDMLALQAGVTMLDLTGDLYDPSPLELSHKPEAIDQQRRTVDRVRALGGEVLMSSHTFVPMSCEQAVEHAQALASRGADMIKIAMAAHTEDDALEALRTTALLKRELTVPYLYICMGQYGKLQRAIGPLLGSSMALCVPTYTDHSHREQPLLRAEKAVFDNVDATVARNPHLGTRYNPAAEG